MARPGRNLPDLDSLAVHLVSCPAWWLSWRQLHTLFSSLLSWPQGSEEPCTGHLVLCVSLAQQGWRLNLSSQSQ